jgi:hypothetical protein
MKISDIKNILPGLADVVFVMEDGRGVPAHFHVTEVGQVTKHFIDCGGTVRHEKRVGFQLWTANDEDHRLKPAKLLSIIELAERTLGLEDAEIEVEYQGQTIGKYSLAFNGSEFVLKNTMTDCLAPDRCVVVPKKRIALADLPVTGSACAPGSGCC